MPPGTMLWRRHRVLDALLQPAAMTLTPFSLHASCRRREDPEGCRHQRRRHPFQTAWPCRYLQELPGTYRAFVKLSLWLMQYVALCPFNICAHAKQHHAHSANCALHDMIPQKKALAGRP